MEITGTVQDLEPKKAGPRLELKFGRRDVAQLPQGDREPITLVIGGSPWRGTICTTNSNPPYLHHPIESPDGPSTTTDLLLSLGLAEKAKLRFAVVATATLRLTEVIDCGKWREGNAPHERAGTGSNSTQRQSDRTDPPLDRSPVTSSFPFHDSAAILQLADRYWTLISQTERDEERAFERELPAARQSGFISKDLFVRLARWKSPRKTPDYRSNADDAIETATRRAFDAVNDDAAISSLVCLRGVALRTATALLHWMVPDRYPILDFRIVAALGETEPKNWDDPRFYSRIAHRVRALAGEHGLDLRTIDRALWAWSKLGGAAA